MNKINWEVVRSGQVAPYADSVYEYHVFSELHETEVKRFCLTFLRKASHQDQSGCFTGHCGFPYGLNSYYSFHKIRDGHYKYQVCEPFCD